MALTQTQLNAHLRAITVQVFTRNEKALPRFLETCVAYANAGGAAEKEAARTIAREVWERVLGRPPTAADLHVLQRHRVDGGDVL